MRERRRLCFGTVAHLYAEVSDSTQKDIVNNFLDIPILILGIEQSKATIEGPLCSQYYNCKRNLNPAIRKRAGELYEVENITSQDGFLILMEHIRTGMFIRKFIPDLIELVNEDQSINETFRGKWLNFINNEQYEELFADILIYVLSQADNLESSDWTLAGALLLSIIPYRDGRKSGIAGISVAQLQISTLRTIPEFGDFLRLPSGNKRNHIRIAQYSVEIERASSTQSLKASADVEWISWLIKPVDYIKVKTARETLVRLYKNYPEERANFHMIISELEHAISVVESSSSVAWYRRLLEWLTVVKQLSLVDACEDMHKPLMNCMTAAERDAYLSFLKRCVQFLYYFQDAESSYRLFQFCAHYDLARLKDHTSWVELQRSLIRYGSIADMDIEPYYHDLCADFHERYDNHLDMLAKNEAELNLYTDIFVIRSQAKSEEINEIQAILASLPDDKRIYKAFYSLQLTHEELVRQMPKLIDDPKLAVLKINNAGSKIILTCAELGKQYTIRVLDANGKKCCSYCPASDETSPKNHNSSTEAIKQDYCRRPNRTCSDCSNERISTWCEFCDVKPVCDYYKVYAGIGHIFYLEKTAWEGERVPEMVIKGLRRGAYRGFGIFKGDLLISYTDVCDRVNATNETALGFSYTISEYRGLGLTAALINKIRMFYHKYDITFTTQQLNSSMRHVANMLGFEDETYRISNPSPRVISEIQTIYYRIAAVAGE